MEWSWAGGREAVLRALLASTGCVQSFLFAADTGSARVLVWYVYSVEVTWMMRVVHSLTPSGDRIVWIARIESPSTKRPAERVSHNCQ